MTNLNSVSQDSLLDFHQRIFRQIEEEEIKYETNKTKQKNDVDGLIITLLFGVGITPVFFIDPESEFFYPMCTIFIGLVSRNKIIYSY